jgi:ribosomal protein S18 acetylase RimI-like enzyme
MLTNLTFRPIRLEDKARILAFTAHTWGEEEGDYIGDVFDAWLADRAGEFTAAVLADQVVGIAKLTDLGDGEWWFEGLRVDPAQRRKGIGEALNRYQVDLARRLGGQVMRYMTGGENTGSQTIGQRAGFEHVITFAAYLADATPEFDLPAVLASDDVGAVLRWQDSPLMRYQHGAYRDSWSVRALNEREIRQTIEARRAYSLKDRAGQIAAWAVLRPSEYDEDSEDSAVRRLRIDHLDGEMAAVIELAQQLRALAAAQNKNQLSAGVSDYPPLTEALKAARYQLNPDNFRLWVMELRL